MRKLKSKSSKILSKPSLIIFTEGHPDIDTGFIAPELNLIHHNFDRILVYPIRWNNNNNNFKFESNIFLKPDLAEFVRTISSLHKKVYGLASSLFWRSLVKIGPSKLRPLLNTCGYISLLGKWINKIDFIKEETLFYTYWLLLPTLALIRLKEKKKINYLISRAHGFDLYNERGDFILNFFKPYIFKRIDGVYCISQNGRQYLTKRYTDYADKFKLSRLGTLNQKKICHDFSDKFEIVSCSFLTHVKRIDLIIRAIEVFQNKFHEIKIVWSHLGGGPLFESIYKLAQERLSPGSFNLRGTFLSVEIYKIYSEKSFRCLLNVSESEGLPVSIMEAQSFGIPVIATKVGGTPEIVNNENGLLLSENPSADEIASALYEVFCNQEKWERKRILSRKNWEENFDAGENYPAFAKDILSIRK